MKKLFVASCVIFFLHANCSEKALKQSGNKTYLDQFTNYLNKKVIQPGANLRYQENPEYYQTIIDCLQNPKNHTNVGPQELSEHFAIMAKRSADAQIFLFENMKTNKTDEVMSIYNLNKAILPEFMITLVRDYLQDKNRNIADLLLEEDNKK